MNLKCKAALISIAFTALFFVFSPSVAAEGPSAAAWAKELEQITLKFKKIDVSKIPLSDLRKFEGVQTPIIDSKSALLPSPFAKESHVKVELWAHGCAPCLVKLEKNWKDPNYIWINVDPNLKEVGKSIDWLKNKKITMGAYYDHSDYLTKQIGERFPIPLEMDVENLKVTGIKIGGPIN